MEHSSRIVDDPDTMLSARIEAVKDIIEYYLGNLLGTDHLTKNSIIALEVPPCSSIPFLPSQMHVVAVCICTRYVRSCSTQSMASCWVSLRAYLGLRRASIG